ncbi:MAG: hypothetical protein HY517_04475 [Candidatus Aenigmarchaeota archaeon]|nr:hypothetical protein [Candidatus Aenigmarchaeota archaeon]
MSTLRRRSDKFVDAIYPHSEAIIQAGSVVYNPDLCTESSDLDYIVVCNEENVPHILTDGNVLDPDTAEGFFRHYKELKGAETVNAIICKGSIEGTIASFNILHPDFFLHNCRLNIESNDDLLVAWKFWNDYEKNKSTKITSFDGKIAEVPKIVRQVGRYWLSRTPIGATIAGRYYVGYYQDQIMCGGEVIKCNEGLRQFYETLRDTMSKRLLRDFPEASRFESRRDLEESGIGFHKSVCRYDKISEPLRTRLIERTLEGIRRHR